jgi:hypothetical protein
MSENSQFNELRKWLASEMQDEAQASGMVNNTEATRMRAMSRAVAYNRVLQKMDEIESANATKEKNATMRVVWHGLVD